MIKCTTKQWLAVFVCSAGLTCSSAAAPPRSTGAPASTPSNVTPGSTSPTAAPPSSGTTQSVKVIRGGDSKKDASPAPAASPSGQSNSAPAGTEAQQSLPSPPFAGATADAPTAAGGMSVSDAGSPAAKEAAPEVQTRPEASSRADVDQSSADINDKNNSGLDRPPGANLFASDDNAGNSSRSGDGRPRNDNDSPLPGGQKVSVGSFGQIDLHVKDINLTRVLTLLSIQSHRNIIASKNVSGKISADLYGVDFYQALDAILHTNGYGYREKGNFIYVYTAAQIAAIKQAERKVTSKVVRLNYINAKDAAAFISPMLSADGSISVSGESEQGFEPSLSDGGSNSYASSDTLIIRDYEENVAQIMDVLKQLDVRPKQVLVQATVLSAQLTEANAFGVDFAIFGNLDPGGLSNPLKAVNSLITGTPDKIPGAGDNSAVTSSPGNVAGGPATIKVGYLGSSAAVFVRALDSVTDTTVLARPKLLVLNRQKADLHVGQRLGYLSSTATDTSTTQTVEFLDVGTNLTLRPFVSNDNMIRLELRPSVSTGDTSRVVNGFVIPDTNDQEMTTNVIVGNGKTVVLGGLFSETTTVGRKQVPGLGDIPVVGNAFKGQDDQVQRNEVIFLIKPSIIKDKSLYAIGNQADKNVELTAMGARKGLLPWSRTKLTAAHMREANQYLKQGKKRKALWETNMALYLDPTMSDALELKQKLTGEKFYYHDFSILDHAIDSAINQQIGEGHATPNDASAPASRPNKAEPTPEPTPAQPAPDRAERPMSRSSGTFTPTPEAASPSAANASPTPGAVTIGNPLSPASTQQDHRDGAANAPMSVAN